MINLQEIANNNYELIYFDGTVLHLKKPTQALLRELLAVSELGDEEVDKMFDVVYTVITKTLNNNIEQRDFTEEQVREDFDIQTAFLFIQDYIEDTISFLGK